MQHGSELILASHNGNFVGVQFHDSICLYRNDALFYQKKGDRRKLGHLIYVSNEGTLIFREGDTLRRIQAGDSSLVETIGRLEGGGEDGSVTQVHTDYPAQRFFFSRTWSEEKGGFLGLLPGKKTVHKLGLFDWVAGSSEQTMFLEEELPQEQLDLFRWDTSHDLSYVVACVPRKGSFEIIALNYIDETTLGNLKFSWNRVDVAQINSKGLVCLLQLDGNATKGVLWDYMNASKVKQFRLPSGYMLNSFSDTNMGFINEGLNRWLATDLDGKTILEVDASPLQALTDSYQILLGRDDSVLIISFKDGNLKVNHSDLQNLEMDAKRWAKLEEQMRLDHQHVVDLEAQHHGIQDRIGTMSERLSATVEQLQSGEFDVRETSLKADLREHKKIVDPRLESGSRWSQLKDELSKAGDEESSQKKPVQGRLSIPIAGEESNSSSSTNSDSVRLPRGLNDNISGPESDVVDFDGESPGDSISAPDKIDL